MKLRVVLKTQTDDEVLNDLIEDINQFRYQPVCLHGKMSGVFETIEGACSLFRKH